MPTESEIRNAVDCGVALYWSDGRLQTEAYEKWRSTDFEGECPQIANGSINDYVHRAVLAVTHGRVTNGGVV